MTDRVDRRPDIQPPAAVAPTPDVKPSIPTPITVFEHRCNGYCMPESGMQDVLGSSGFVPQVERHPIELES